MCCWAGTLWTRLRSAGYTSIDFVGPRGNDDPADMSRDDDSNAWGGYAISNILKPSSGGAMGPGGYYSDSRDLTVFFGATTADVVLWHIGTNDRWGNIAPSVILSGYSAALSAIRARNPDVTILVAQILPMAISGVDVKPLNDAIPAWAAANSTATSRIVVVDMNTGFDTAWTTDGVHPYTTQGTQFIVDRWFPALRAVLP